MASSTLSRIRSQRTAAHIVPLAVFLVVMMLVPAVKIDHPAQPWWRAAPEHWVYPLQTVLSLGLVAFWWRQYRFAPLDARRLGFGALIGVVGIALWLLPVWIHHRTGADLRALGVDAREGPGFNPDVFPAFSPPWWTTVILRFVRMTVAVALVEEIFWRGFLWRCLVDLDRPWQENPFGALHWRAWLGTSVLMMVAHQPVDWVAAFVWSLLAGVVAVRTRSLAACVVCHGVSNFLLGLFIMATRKWGLW